jgi:cysteine desulfurase
LTEQGFVKQVYFDYNATTPIDPEVARTIQPFVGELFGNPSSLHWAGREVRGRYEKAKEQVAAIIHAAPEEIVFTSCGSESDNHAIKGVAYSRKGVGNHIITTAVEHPAVLHACRYLEGAGFSVTYLPVDHHGRVDPDSVRSAIRKETILISIMFANNETGTISPLMEIGEIAREREVLFHSDMVQALGKIPIDVKSLHVDLASFSGHKVAAPKGIGALYMRKGLEIDNLVHGGGQESGRRAGTENMIGIAAFGRACELAGYGMTERNARIETLRKRLLEGVLGSVEKVTLNGDPDHRLPNTLNLSFAHAEGESLLISLDLNGIAVSSGSACASGSTEPSHVLSAMGIPAMLCQSAVRMSLGPGNTVEEVDYALSVIPGLVGRLREMSPFHEEGNDKRLEEKGRASGI